VLSSFVESRLRQWCQLSRSSSRYGLRFSALEAIGQPVAFVVPPEHRAEQQRLLLHISRGERTEEWRTSLCGKSGNTVPGSLTLSPVKERSGNLIGASLIACAGSPDR
jgi:PAS domain S-box-containing protein